ncbi:hypothetical protein QTP88_015689 [Uroleucon formosanum]
MDRTRVVTSKSWDPTRVLPEKHRDLSRLNKGFADPTNKRKVIETSGQHNHDQNSIEKIEQQILRENCKRKAEESITTRSIKIIRTELLNSSSTSNLNSQNVRNVRKAMYDKRKQTYPKLPTSTDETNYQLNKLQNEDCFKFKCQQFIYMPTEIILYV